MGKIKYSDSIRDIMDGLYLYKLWSLLSIIELKQRYARTKIGPWWITISIAILLICIGPLYSFILKTDTNEYILYLGTSYIIWLYLSNQISESCTVYIGAAGFINEIKLPMSIYAYKMVMRNFLIFLHHSIVIIIIVFLFKDLKDLNSALLFIPFYMILIMINAFSAGIVLGILCARFRDFQQFVNNGLLMLFFLTPILWKSEMLGKKYLFAADFNPLYHFIEILRQPIVYGLHPTKSLYVVLAITFFMFILMLKVFSKNRNKIGYFL